MRPTSAAFRRAILGTHHLITVVEWTSDHETWHIAAVVEGSVTADATAQVRWSCTLTLAVGTPYGLGGVHPYGGRVRVRRGVRVPRGAPELVPLGLYRVESVSIDETGAVSVTGQSLEAQVADTTFTSPRTVGGGPGDTARGLIEALITEAVPDAQFQWRINGSIRVPKLTQDQDRWALIDGGTDDSSIAKSLAAQVYTDGAGRFVIAPLPTLHDDPVWTIEPGQALVTASRSLSREDVHNVVVVTGQPLEKPDKETMQSGIATAPDDGSLDKAIRDGTVLPGTPKKRKPKKDPDNPDARAGSAGSSTGNAPGTQHHAIGSTSGDTGKPPPVKKHGEDGDASDDKDGKDDAESTIVGPAVAWDTNPASPFYAGPDPVARPDLAGPFGISVRYYDSSALTSTGQCQATAIALLAQSVGLNKQLDFSSLANPALEVGDTVRVRIAPRTLEHHIVDSITWDLKAAAMDCRTRSTATDTGQ